MPPTIKTRFAPSPTGHLHLGNARTALFNALLALKEGGDFVLRLEDTDRSRSDLDHATAVAEDLQWLGLTWQEGPDVGGPHGPYRQSERGAIHDQYLERLVAGGHCYPCFCSEADLKRAREAQRAAGRPPRYPGTCRRVDPMAARDRVAAGEAHALRFRVPDTGEVAFDDLVHGRQRFACGDIGDFVVRRADGTPAFFFSNAVDDALMGITDVLRGDDHLTNTPRQLLILQTLGLAAPRYGHMGVIVGPDRAPLSKRHGSVSLRALQAAGYRSEAVVNYLARLGHTYDDAGPMTVAALAADFRLDRLGRAPAQFQQEQLDYWQREALRHADPATLWQWMGEAVHRLVPEDQREAFVDTVRANALWPDDALLWARVLYTDEVTPDGAARQRQAEVGPRFFEHVLAAYDHAGGDLNVLTAHVKERTGARGRAMFEPLRAALTGRTEGPELGALLALMPPERARRRLALAAASEAGPPAGYNE